MHYTVKNLTLGKILPTTFYLNWKYSLFHFEALILNLLATLLAKIKISW
jgi:hypothetical protein